VVIRSQETGLHLPPAPEFGPNGTWPPEVTEWIPLSWQLFEASNTSLSAAATYTALRLLWYRKFANPLYNANALQEEFLSEFFARFPSEITVSESSRAGVVTVRRGPRTRDLSEKCAANSPELRRLVYSVRWRRKDPITRLPPGATYEMTHSLTTGLSVERSVILANSLGVALGSATSGMQAKLDWKIQQQFALKLDLTAEENKSETVTLQNNHNDCSILYASWHKEYLISITALDVGPFNLIMSDKGPSPHWRLRGSVEFATESSPHITSVEYGG
jgi:hypothetical protein